MSGMEEPSPRLPVVAPRGELDLHSLGSVAAELEEAAAAHPVVIVDASGVAFADSSFINVLLLAHQRSQVRVAAARPQLRRVLELMGADQILRLYGTVEQARAAGR